MGFAILGLYLPLTIYLQSVLGLSAQDAGLTIAIQPLTTMFVSGLAGFLISRLSPKYLLMPGLLALAMGSAWIVLLAQPGSSRWTFAPALVLSGIGMGFIWTPLFGLATRDLRPELAGVASGVVSTIQELGGVIASAAVGALLQNRLAVALQEQAVRAATQPRPAAHDVFARAFTSAMRPSMALPIAVLVLAALCCLALRAGGPVSEVQPAGTAVVEPQDLEVRSA
jgi:MFS family permease